MPNGSFNLTGVPSAVQSQMMLNSLELAEFVTMFIVMLMVLVVVAFFTTQVIVIASVEVLTLLFGVAIGWVDPWVTILLAMLIGGMWSFGFMKNTLE
jgi:hypothetical protein